jgi:uncharacterized protein with beta-barrel porin domain
VLTLKGRVAWAHDWISAPSILPTFQSLPGASFIVTGAAPPKDLLLTSAGFDLRVTSGVNLLTKFDGEFGNHSQMYSGTATLRYTW